MAEAENDQDNGIWWDLENCGVPRDMDAQSVLPMIEERLWREGYTGPLRSFRVFVRNKESVPPWVLQRLDNLVEIHFINDYDAIKEDIKLWLGENPGNQNIMIITGDNGFYDTFETLQAAGHSTMLAFRPNDPQHVISTRMHEVVNSTWHWRFLLGLGPEPVPGEVARMRLPAGQAAQQAKRLRKREREIQNKKKKRPSKKERDRMKQHNEANEEATATAVQSMYDDLINMHESLACIRA